MKRVPGKSRNREGLEMEMEMRVKEVRRMTVPAGKLCPIKPKPNDLDIPSNGSIYRLLVGPTTVSRREFEFETNDL
jgi:hypothetical protein